MRITLTVVALAMVLSLSACGRSKSRDEVDPVSNQYDKAEMDKAIAAAKETQDQFDGALKANKGEYFAVKRAFDTKDGDVEQCWVGYVRLVDNQYVGRMDSDPRHLKGIKAGTPVKVRHDEIEDWMIVKDRLVYGGYTTKVLMKNASEKQKRKINFAPPGQTVPQ